MSIRTVTVTVFCLIYFLGETDAFFVKSKNVPRVGRSNEADGPFDQNAMGYVIKTIPSKNIPRMGRRNYDSENRYDIPKLYALPTDHMESYGDRNQREFSQDEIEAYYGNQLENLKR